jgi:hypothetical protein
MSDGAIQWPCTNPKCTDGTHNNAQCLDQACQALQPLPATFAAVISKSPLKSVLGSISRSAHACFEQHLLAKGCRNFNCAWGHDLDPVKDYDEQRRAALVHMTSNRVHATDLNVDACDAWGIGFDDLSPSLQARHPAMSGMPSVPRHLRKGTATATANSLTFAEGTLAQENFMKTYQDRPEILEKYRHSTETAKMQALIDHKRGIMDP